MEPTLLAADLGRSLQHPQDYASPQVLIGDLTPDQATQTPPGAPYSIAENVAHMHAWQNYIVRRVRGENPPRPDGEADWPKVEADAWPVPVADFLAGIRDFEALLTAPAAGALLARPYSDDHTNANRLLNIALHNAYHLGQVTLLRRELGLWPPEGDDEAAYTTNCP